MKFLMTCNYSNSERALYRFSLRNGTVYIKSTAFRWVLLCGAEKESFEERPLFLRYIEIDNTPGD